MPSGIRSGCQARNTVTWTVPQTKKLLVFVKVDPASIDMVPGYTRDVSNIGHFGTGDLEITMGSIDDLERAKPLLLSSYEGS